MNSGPPPISALLERPIALPTIDTFAVAGVGMLYTDLIGRCVAVNPALCRMTGFSDADIVGQSVAMLAPPNFTDETARLHALLARGNVDRWAGETRLRRSDG